MPLILSGDDEKVSMAFRALLGAHQHAGNLPGLTADLGHLLAEVTRIVVTDSKDPLIEGMRLQKEGTDLLHVPRAHCGSPDVSVGSCELSRQLLEVLGVPPDLLENLQEVRRLVFVLQDDGTWAIE